MISRAGLGGLAIDLAFSHLGQLFVGCLLFIQRLIEKRCGVIAPQLLGPGNQRAVPRHPVMFDRSAAAIDPISP
jgi:hypothetical protein